MPDNVESMLRKTIAYITGLKGFSIPLGSVKIKNGTFAIQNHIADFFKAIVSDNPINSDHDLIPVFDNLKKDFIEFYCDEINAIFLKERMDVLNDTEEINIRAKAAAEIWAPEIAMPETDILSRWRLDNVMPNQKPYLPDEIVLQLNALYSLPESIPESLPQKIMDEWKQVKEFSHGPVFDYDHPVPLFSPDKHHELIRCLDELDKEIGFEKSMGVFLNDYNVPVVISISVTHPYMDRLCGTWVQHVLKEKRYHHLRLYLITESVAQTIKKVLGFYPTQKAVFTVNGKYANHFNVLKYFQLILEETDGIRAGFKIDSDEGIRSRDLYEATGRTWFQTLCHQYWGGTALDERKKAVYLGVVEGEYINEKDIIELGYHNCLRVPDVAFDGNYNSTEIFFNKGVAHSKATALYNREAEMVEDFLSHPVVKGGGYGIDNSALRRFVPFSFSEVGRAEDQQFYMAGLAKGNRGIFTPDLRIAHYKQSVATTESSTEVTRFLGDMFRLVIFKEITDFLAIKDKIDPMPGVFAGSFARLQAFCSIIYKSFIYYAKEEPEKGELLYDRGVRELQTLIHEIDSGKIRKDWETEQRDWEGFIKALDSCKKSRLSDAVKATEVAS